MKIKIQTVKVCSTLILLAIAATGVKTFAQAVPTEYYPNYAIKSDWDKIQEYFVQIDAAQKIGNSVNSDIFGELNKNFKSVFANFPQDYNFKVTYQQCLQTSEYLTNNYSETSLQTFMNTCYKPLNQIISKINSSYTVKVNATRNPGNGAAPLTVTFDARASKDPSNETIPSKNFYRYYRDTKGIDRVMGIGNVINYTFDEPGNYTVHLTVRSSNVNAKGILDGETNLIVDVAPKAANIVIYANTKKLEKTKSTKIGTQEAKKGVILDGSATLPTGGRKIQSHKWEIMGSDGFRFTKEGTGNPTYINVPLNGNGEYLVKLSTTDNENNNVSETFSITVSDPVAIIKKNPTEGNTSTTFSFDSNSSYSLTSRLKLYTWEIFDSNGDKIDTFQGKTIKKQFVKPGNYMIKLTIEDELGQSNVDTQELYVESSTPIPQFTITPTNKWTYPSEFHLDANSTIDIDVNNKYDSLEYKREFSNPNVSVITETEDNNRKVVVQFNETGKHTIKLTATDMYGKSASVEKIVEVKSIVRPELIITPNAITRGKNVGFEVKSNRNIINYQWNFGDGDTKSNQESKLTHIYQKIGIYNVSVIVNDAEGNTNGVTEKVFIGETGFPIAAFRIKNNGGFFLQRSEGVCSVTEDGKTQNYDAFIVDRYQDITIDPSISVNSKGTNVGLVFYFQPKYEEVYKQNSFSHKFNEIGCQYIDLTIDDTTVGKQDHERIRFKVNNALPTLKNITLSFPQYGNESGIGFQENNVQNVLEPTGDSSSNLIVKVTANNAYDPDGSIAYFKWYYYPKDNPNKILETRITPTNIPYTFFTVPRIAGEFMFGVTMYDNNDGVKKSEDIIGNGPTIFFPPNNNNPEIPIVTLKSDKLSVNVGEEVTFDVIAKITSENEDFKTDKTIYYDFDGDGERDLITTKDRVTHTYTKPNEQGYKPQAAVVYRGYKGLGEGNIVIVKNGVKPILTFNSIKDIVIIRDLSAGSIIYRQICFNKQECDAGNNQYKKTHIVSNLETLKEGQKNPINQNKVFLQRYPGNGEYGVTINLKSNVGIVVTGVYNLELSQQGLKVNGKEGNNNSRIASGVYLVTIPEASLNNSNPEIYVAKSMENSVLYYLHYEGEGKCYIDTDTSIDSDKDGKTDNDQDIPCNTLTLREYDPQFESIMGRIYFDYQGKFVFKNFAVNFEGYDIVMDQTNLLLYQDITTLMNGIQDSNSGNADLKVLLDSLRKNLLDKNQTSSTIIAIQTHLTESVIYIDQDQKDLLDSILSRLSNIDTISALGGNEYDKAKEEILTMLPTNFQTDVTKMFSSFELKADNLTKEEKKEEMEKIYKFIGENAEKYEVSQEDVKNFFLPQICKILDYYDISSNACNSEIIIQPDIPPEDTTQKESKSLPTLLKVILRIILGGIIIVGGTIVFFAVKAKLKDSNQDEEEEE